MEIPFCLPGYMTGTYVPLENSSLACQVGNEDIDARASRGEAESAGSKDRAHGARGFTGIQPT